MKNLNRFLLPCFVLVLIAGCAKMEIEPDPLYSSDDTALKGAKIHMVPFKSAFDTWGISEEYIFPPEGGYPVGVHVIIEGSGKATHLGKTSITVDQLWYVTGPGAPLHGTSVITLTAANGDVLIANFTGEMVGNMDFTYIEISGSCVFDGGTGRFADAEGELVLEGTYEKFAPDAIDGEGATFMTGAIMY